MQTGLRAIYSPNMRIILPKSSSRFWREDELAWGGAVALKALRGFAAFEPGSNFKAWIFRILRNTYLTSRAGLAARHTVALEDELNENGESGPVRLPEAAIDRQTPETNLLQMSDLAALQAAMETLPPPLLEVILLCDVEEMKYREISTALEIPIGTVMSRIARARAALRAALEAQRSSPRGARA